MLDQCHNIEEKIPGQIRSVLNVQEMTARALLVDRPALLAAANRTGDVLAANEILHGRVLHRRPRRSRRMARARAVCPHDPLAAYRASGYGERIVAERVGGTPSRLGRVTVTSGRAASSSPARTGSAPTRATPTTRAATPRPRAPRLDPVTGADVELMWVKGSGGDLGTLTE